MYNIRWSHLVQDSILKDTCNTVILTKEKKKSLCKMKESSNKATVLSLLKPLNEDRTLMGLSDDKLVNVTTAAHHHSQRME